jgi:hypothetical protein
MDYVITNAPEVLSWSTTQMSWYYYFYADFNLRLLA